MIDHDNGFDRLINASQHGVGLDSPADRLYNAWITLIPLQPSGFASKLRERFADLHARGTSVEGGPEGSLKATLAEMSDHELGEATEGITALITEVAYYRGRRP